MNGNWSYLPDSRSQVEKVFRVSRFTGVHVPNFTGVNETELFEKGVGARVARVGPEFHAFKCALFGPIDGPLKKRLAWLRFHGILVLGTAFESLGDPRLNRSVWWRGCR